MKRRGILLRFFLCLLTLSVVFEGLLGVIPHDHMADYAPEFVCDNPNCPAPDGAHLGKVGAEHADHDCLACSVHSPQFFATGYLARLGIGGSVPARFVSHHSGSSISDRWFMPLRGPPAVA